MKIPRLKTKYQLGLYLLLPFILFLLPLSFLEAGPQLCLFKNIFGWECPGCGMTRAVVSMMHGGFMRAWGYNKLVVVLLPLLCYLYLQNIFIVYRRSKACPK